MNSETRRSHQNQEDKYFRAITMDISFSRYLMDTLGKGLPQSCGLDISSSFSQAHTGPITAAGKHMMENFHNPCTDTWKIILAGYNLL